MVKQACSYKGALLIMLIVRKETFIALCSKLMLEYVCFSLLAKFCILHIPVHVSLDQNEWLFAHLSSQKHQKHYSLCLLKRGGARVTGRNFHLTDT